MIHLKRNGRGFIASATLECVGAMLAHHRASTPVITPAKPMPKVTIKFDERDYYIAMDAMYARF